MKKRMATICYVLAAICLVYCIGVMITKAAGTMFYLIWIAGAAFLAFLGTCFARGWFLRLPRWVNLFLLIAAASAAAWVLIVEGLVISGFFSKGEPGLSHIIVLGAQIKENGPSVALARRLDAACRYLNENPETVCVVSGGQGANEPMSEADGMYGYLVGKGIAPDRIIKEDASINTFENLTLSRRLIPRDVVKVGIVTSDFHVYRGVRLAKAHGFPDAVGIAATSGIYFLPNNMTREFFGIMKDRLFGNMRLF